MVMPKKHSVPPGHPLRYILKLFTQMSFERLGINDREIIDYVSEILTDFSHVDNMYRITDETGEKLIYLVDMLLHGFEGSAEDEREAHKYIGDYCMFIVGLFPESLRRPRRSISPSYYIDQGKSSYMEVSRMDCLTESASFFRKLADRFEECVVGLHIERNYLNDPFYQYLMRQVFA